MNASRYISDLKPIIYYIFKIYLSGLLILTLLRVLLLLAGIQYTDGINTSYLSEAFFIGFFLDNVIVGTISLLPIICALIIATFGPYRKIFRYGYNIYYILAFIIVIGFSVANIPYFIYFFKHIDISAFSWLSQDKEGFGMILTESSYYKYFALFIILSLVFSLCIVLFSRQWFRQKGRIVKNKTKEIILFTVTLLILGTLTYMGVSRKYRYMEKITVWTPYLSPDSFYNNLSVNTLYNTLRSLLTPKYTDKEMGHIIGLDQSFEMLKKDFPSGDFNNEVSPISRNIIADGEERHTNIVIIMMESMSSYYINDKPELTPHLNDLKSKSYYFDNFYSVASHTAQGVFASLYGFPAFFDKAIMDDRIATGVASIPLCEGLPYNLNEKGYISSFFISHNKSYNNMDAFLLKNGYFPQNIHSSTNYPQEKLLSYWGVADDYLFEYSLNILNNEEQPFFGTIMTMSNHPDYIVPKEYMKVSKEPSERTVRFADQCIHDFMEDASKQDWYDNTIFVFVGDHGKIVGKQPYAMPLSLNHIPLIIYSPLFDDAPKVFHQTATQIDIFPTIMGLLNISYENNSMGIDLLRENRPYEVFSTDDKLGCINSQYLYCYDTTSKKEVMYDYAAGNTNDISALHKEAFDSIRTYAAATVQVSNYLLNNDLTRRKPGK